MKKLMALVLGMALLLGALGAFAEGEALTFEDLSGLTWEFSSGAGGWSTELFISEDGTFSGAFHDSEMGEMGDEYPNGSFYYCNFNGEMSIVEQLDEHSWKLHVDSLTVEKEAGEESIEDEIRYVSTDPYGISEGDDFTLYLPGTPVDALTEDMLMWAHLLGEDQPEALEDWFLYSEKSESGFVGFVMEDVGMVNPWVEMSGDELWQTAGVTLNLPEGAENVIYQWMSEDGLAEMMFTLDGDEYCARVKPAALEAGQLENISGMYFQWEHEEPITVGTCEGTIGLAQTGSEDWVELCMWYDVAPGLMYSLSVYTTDPDGLDLVAVAEMVYEPMQGDA